MFLKHSSRMSERKSWDVVRKPAQPKAAPKAIASDAHPVATHAPTLSNGPRRGTAKRAAGKPLREKRQNVFDDLHSAAERLVADGWTSSDRLAISGGSNGGLLVGAAMTQRPELYAAVVCSAPLLDMAPAALRKARRTRFIEMGRLLQV